MKKSYRIIFTAAGILVLAVLVNFVPLVSLKMPGMEAFSSHGITVYAMTGDQGDAERIAERISRQSARVSHALGMAEESAVEVILYPNQKDLHRKTLGFAGAFLPAWFIGDNTRKYVLITSPASPGPAHTRESVEQAAVHEYTHVLTDRRNKSLGYWLKEGIALYLAEQVPTRESVRSYSGLTWEEFSRPNALQFAQVGGYSLAYTLIEYLLENHGWEAVVRLIQPDASFESVLGYGERELFEGWTAWRNSSFQAKTDRR